MDLVPYRLNFIRLLCATAKLINWALASPSPRRPRKILIICSSLCLVMRQCFTCTGTKTRSASSVCQRAICIVLLCNDLLVHHVWSEFWHEGVIGLFFWQPYTASTYQHPHLLWRHTWQETCSFQQQQRPAHFPTMGWGSDSPPWNFYVGANFKFKFIQKVHAKAIARLDWVCTPVLQVFCCH